MADCSKTEVFLKELVRMCSFTPCTQCDFGDLDDVPCDAFYKQHPKEAISFVQKWSDEHPLPPSKTYADVFFEQHPKATRLENGRPRAYRCEVYGCECKYKCPPDVIESTFNTDRDPCKICWNEPYPEQEASNE